MASNLLYIQAKKNVKFPSDDGLLLNTTPLITSYCLIALDQANANKNRTNLAFQVNPKTGEVVFPVTEYRNDGHFSIEQAGDNSISLVSDPNLTPPSLYNVLLYPCS